MKGMLLMGDSPKAQSRLQAAYANFLLRTALRSRLWLDTAQRAGARRAREQLSLKQRERLLLQPKRRGTRRPQRPFALVGGALENG